MSLRNEDVKSVLSAMLRRETEWLHKKSAEIDKIVQDHVNNVYTPPWEKPGWREPQEPSVVERIGGLDDPEIAERCRVYDAWVAAGRPKPPTLPPWAKTAVRNIPTPLVHVSPMPQPVGGIAFYRPRYGSKSKD